MHHGSGLSPALLLCPAVELFLLLLLGLVLEIGSRSSYEHEPEHEHEHEPEHEYRIRNEQGSVREKRNRKKDRKAETSRPVGATVSDSGTSSRITVNLVTPWERRETGWQRQRRPRRLR